MKDYYRYFSCYLPPFLQTISMENATCKYNFAYLQYFLHQIPLTNYNNMKLQGFHTEADMFVCYLFFIVCLILFIICSLDVGLKCIPVLLLEPGAIFISVLLAVGIKRISYFLKSRRETY